MTSGYPKQIVVFMILIVGMFMGLNQDIALAQSPISAQADRSSLTMDEQLVLTVTITGDFLKIPRPDLSQLQNFVVVSSSTSTQVSIVNGQMTSQGVFTYRLQPLHEGQLSIAPVTVNIDGQVYQTDPIEVEVLASGSPVVPTNPNLPEGNAPGTLRGQDFFVEAEVDNPTPYLGQQIIYTFRIYQALNFPPGQPDYTPPAFTDFWSSEILAQPHYNTQAAGRDYLVTEILTALFPANLGSITIEPASLVIPGGLLSPDIRLETNPVTIDVRPLPNNAPDNFTGAVGEFEIRASLNEAEIKVNEPLTLIVEVKGTGNIQTLKEPELPPLDNWRFFESQISTTTETGEGFLRGSRTFERLVVPGQAGEQTFPPISFSYYDPKVDAYQTISSEPILVNVLPNDAAPAPFMMNGEPGVDKQPVELIASDIRHIKAVPAALDTARVRSMAEQTLYWACWFLPVVMISVVQIWKSRRRRLQEDTAYARRLRAKRAALATLAEAKRGSAENRPAAAAGRALLGYLSDKLNTPTTGLTTDGLINLLRQSRLKSELIERVEQVLHQIDVGRFAPISEGDERTLIAETHALINALEKSLSRQRR
jgi:hypothetical protein